MAINPLRAGSHGQEGHVVRFGRPAAPIQYRKELRAYGRL
jgi:hypothetical protein